jgi:hypothetical protein
MKHGISFIKVDNSALQQAILNNESKDRITFLKQQVAWYCVYGFQYDKVTFKQLANILNNDYGFTPFKYKSIEEGAIYDKEKHPEAFGRIRGRDNVNNNISWICLDIDKSFITDKELHQILYKYNHHIARTSNKNNPYKFRVILELDKVVTISEDMWKPFIKSIGSYLGLPSLDMLGRSQVFFGYEGRDVLSIVDATPLSTTRHIQMALTKVAELEEKRATALPSGEANALLERPFSTFAYAYEALEGEGTNKMLSAIYKAKELGASPEYIVNLIYSINAFWDHSMPEHRLKSTVLAAV